MRVPAASSQLLELGGDLDATLARVSVPVFVTDEHGVIRWLNAAAVELFGDLRGRSAANLVAPADRKDAERTIARKLIGVDDTTYRERTIRRRDGKDVRVEVCGRRSSATAVSSAFSGSSSRSICHVAVRGRRI